MDYTSLGLYTPTQAARITGSDVREIRRWIFGDTDKDGNDCPPLWLPRVELRGDKSMAFSDLMEIRIIRAMAQNKVTLDIVRLILLRAKQTSGTTHPLSTRGFLTKGKSIFQEVRDNGAAQSGIPGNLGTFEKIIRPDLYAGVEFNEAAFETEGDKKQVAAQFDIPVSDVSAAVKYEDQLKAA